MMCESVFNVGEACAVACTRGEEIDAALEQVLESSVRLPGTPRAYLVISDLHLGDGSNVDASRAARPALVHLLNTYVNQISYFLVLLGDVEELWKFSPESIIEQQRDVYNILRVYHDQGRLIRIFGNHDALWSDPAMATRYLEPLFPGITVHESVQFLLPDAIPVLLTHGHQGMYDTGSCWTRFSERFLRSVWNPLLQCCSSSADYCCIATPAYSASLRGVLEPIYARFGYDHKLVLVTGHTHNGMVDTRNQSMVNTGCASHPDGSVDFLVIENDTFTLNKLSPLLDTTISCQWTFRHFPDHFKPQPIEIDIA
jgi:UDP-2,3-diacylglucosamine pyrophosphatase LpxH